MRVPNIQLLRLAAAVGVAGYHLGCHAPVAGVDVPWLRNPWLAGFPVPLFFAVSGFVLAGAARSTPPGRFLLARFLRLYPGYWLALLGAAGLMWAGLLTESHRAAVGLVNRHTVTLWPAGAGRVLYLLGVEWSLVYEVFLSAAVAGLSLFGPRRGLPALVAGWLVVLAVKVAGWPGRFFDPFPHWSAVGLSAYCTPFLFGVLAYQLRHRGRRWRWVVLAAVPALLAVGPVVPVTAEVGWCVWGLAAAGVVWLAGQVRQVSDRHPLARLGDCTYGLFLVHVPLLLVVLHAAVRLGWTGRPEVAVGAGLAAVVGGLLFGRLEAALHARLRPLTAARRSSLPPCGGGLGWGGSAPTRYLCVPPRHPVPTPHPNPPPHGGREPE